MITLSKALCLVLVTTAAQAHNAPLGWAYDQSCCSNTDCHQVDPKGVQETNKGYIITATQELIPYKDTRIKRSHDEFFHQCVGKAFPLRSYCLYVPDRGF